MPEDIKVSFENNALYRHPELMELRRGGLDLVGRREGGFVLAPDAKVDDGWLDFVHAADLSRYDRVLLDTGAGISDVVLYTVSLADEVLVVATPEPTSLTDAYATIKVLATQQQRRHVGLVLSGLLVGILLSRSVAGGLSTLGGWSLVYQVTAVAMAVMGRGVPRHPVVQPWRGGPCRPIPGTGSG